MARESTLEVPEGVAPAAIEAALLGRVVRVEATPDGAHRAVIDYPVAVLDGSLPQLLNVLHGNVSLLPGVRLMDVELPEAVLEVFPGPRFDHARGEHQREEGDAEARHPARSAPPSHQTGRSRVNR